MTGESDHGIASTCESCGMVTAKYDAQEHHRLGCPVRRAALGIGESGDEPEFDGPSCERCGIEPAATCECDEHLWNGAFCSRCGADEASGFAALPCRPEGD